VALHGAGMPSPGFATELGHGQDACLEAEIDLQTELIGGKGGVVDRCLAHTVLDDELRGAQDLEAAARLQPGKAVRSCAVSDGIGYSCRLACASALPGPESIDTRKSVAASPRRPTDFTVPPTSGRAPRLPPAAHRRFCGRPSVSEPADTH